VTDAGAKKPPPPAMPQRGPFGMQMGPPQKPKNFGGAMRRMLARVGPERKLVILVILCSLLAVTMTISGPKLLGRAMDIIFRGAIGASLPANQTTAQVVAAMRAAGDTNQADMIERMDVTPGVGIDFGALRDALLLVLVLYVAASLFTWLQGYILNHVTQRTVRRLRAEVQDKLARLPLSYFDIHPHGEILSRVTNDIDNVAQSLQQSLSQLMNGLLISLGVLAMLFVISPLLALIAMVTLPLSVVATARIAKRSQKRFGAQWKHVGALNGQIEEAFSGHSLIKVLGRRKEVEERFAVTNEALYDASFRAQFMSSVIMPAINFVGNLNYVAIAVVGGLRVASGAMSLGDVQAFIQYSRQFSQQLGQLASMSNVLQSGLASAERVFELLDTQDQPAEFAPAATLGNVTGEVRFTDVSFRYKPEQPLIEHLSLVAKPGQTVAIVGPTGAGKTTLVNLIMRFYELDSGHIEIDGVDIAKVTRHDVRAKLGMVLQDTWLFSGTIRDNIRYGNLQATDDDIVEAAKATYVDRFVRALPKGYDTLIDDEGGNVSAGEKQLITIARAFLADPSILILDEATSSVDTRTEVLVQQAMAALRARRTSFVIAHRLSTIRDADTILVMDNGQIVEQGSHAELLAKQGAYHRLYTARTG